MRPFLPSFPYLRVAYIALVAVLAAALVAPARAADNGATVTRVPITANFTNPCTGESGTYSGTVVSVTRQFVTPSGGNHLTFTQALQDGSAVSASGTIYRIVNTVRAAQLDLPSGGGVTSTTHEFRAISQGSRDNFMLRFTLQSVIVNGEVVVFNVNLVTECLG